MKINVAVLDRPVCVIADISVWARSKPGEYREVNSGETLAAYLNLLVCPGSEFQGKASSLAKVRDFYLST